LLVIKAIHQDHLSMLPEQVIVLIMGWRLGSNMRLTPVQALNKHCFAWVIVLS